MKFQNLHYYISTSYNHAPIFLFQKVRRKVLKRHLDSCQDKFRRLIHNDAEFYHGAKILSILQVQLNRDSYLYLDLVNTDDYKKLYHEFANRPIF